MIEGIRNVFKIPDLRKRVFYTFVLLAVYRIGAQVPTPGIDSAAVAQMFAEKGSFMAFIDMFSGRALSNMTVFALGIMPYISASIILQLLTVVWPYLEKLSKEGDVGRKKITQYTRYGTVVLSVLQASGIAIALERTKSMTGAPLVPEPGFKFLALAVITLTTGTAFIMWLGEQISDRGVGNGISLIIFAGIVVGFAPGIGRTIQGLEFTDPLRIFQWLVLIVFMVFVVGFIVFVERGQRRFPVQYAKRVMGRRMYGGQTTHLPLKVNTGGVIPVIFASSILIIPQLISKSLSYIPFFQSLYDQTLWGQPLYNVIYIASIIFFSYFYTSIIFNPIDVADNMKKYGGYIPGIRPGKNTADFIDRALSRITFGGALYLAAVAILPEFLISGFKVKSLPFIGQTLHDTLPRFITEGLGVTFYFGGTSLLIVVGVAMDTVQQIESQLIMRHYEGFLKGGIRIRGRR
jgi:preprotein translocase subunit SecY